MNREDTPRIEVIPVESIRANRFQARQEFETDQLQGLAQSIQNYGLIQPVSVIAVNGGEFELIAGERRWRAAQLAGLKEIPAIIRTVADSDQAMLSLIENLQREGLNPVEEAEGMLRVLKEFELTQDELARHLGVSQPTVANKLRLLRATPQVKEALRRRSISEGHGRAVLRLPDLEDQKGILEQILSEGLTVRQTEELVAGRVEAISREINGDKEKRSGATVKGIFKDIRIFVNSIKQVVDTLREVGFDAEMSQEDRGEFIEVSVRIPKAKRQ